MQSPIIQAPFVGNDGRPLIEPGSFYLDGDYSLRVNSWNAVVGVAITIRVRLIRATDGELVDSDFVHTPNTNRTKATTDFPLPAGFILNVTVFASAGAPLIGQTFVQVQLTRGLTGATLLLATILQDYVTAVQALAYPGSPIRSSIEGGGYPRAILGTGVGPGVEINEQVPTGARWQLLALSIQLDTSAAVANRFAALRLINSGGIIANCVCTTPQTAGLSGVFTWGPAMPLGTIASWPLVQGAFPAGIILLAGNQIATLTGGLQAADNWHQPIYQVTEWLEAAA